MGNEQQMTVAGIAISSALSKGIMTLSKLLHPSQHILLWS